MSSSYHISNDTMSFSGSEGTREFKLNFKPGNMIPFPQQEYRYDENPEIQDVDDMVGGPLDLDHLNMMILVEDLFGLSTFGMQICYTVKIEHKETLKGYSGWLHLTQVGAALFSCRNKKGLKEKIIYELGKPSNGNYSVTPNEQVYILGKNRQQISTIALMNALLSANVFELRFINYGMKECISDITLNLYDGLIMRHHNQILVSTGRHFDPVSAKAKWRHNSIFDIGCSYSSPNLNGIQPPGDIILFRVSREIENVSSWGMCIGALTQIPKCTTGSLRIKPPVKERNKFGDAGEVTLCHSLVYPNVVHNIKSFHTNWSIPTNIRDSKARVKIVEEYFKFVTMHGLNGSVNFSGYRVESRLAGSTLSQVLNLVRSENLCMYQRVYELANIPIQLAIARLPLVSYIENGNRMLHAIVESGDLNGSSTSSASKKLQQALCDLMNSTGIHPAWRKVAPTIPAGKSACWYEDPKGLICMEMSNETTNGGTGTMEPKDIPEDEIIRMEKFVKIYSSKIMPGQFRFKWYRKQRTFMGPNAKTTEVLFQIIWTKFGHSWTDHVVVEHGI